MRYTARVVEGRGEGRKLGFPTINLELPAGLDAKPGIYAGWAWMGEVKYPAAIHYGPAPAFGVETASLEVHIIDQEIVSPPDTLSVQLVKYLRPVLDFEVLERLAEQIREDVRQARAILKKV